jgi:predicted alpha/beta-hydrolase family hydrolase
MDILNLHVSAEKGNVSACHLTAAKPIARLVFGHGAGANMQHSHMQQLADALKDNGIDTLRYNFPYMERGGGRTDKLEICTDTIRAALELGANLPPKLPMFLAGHSFGGRMSSHFAASEQPDIAGIVYFSFPLHPSKKPDTKRAEHLSEITIPQHFISGTRDTLAELPLLEPIVKSLTGATLHKIDTADHSFKILKRTRQSSENVYNEAARSVRAFIERSIARLV